MKYRISKYNPKYRDENDNYLNNEWTDYSDIGRSFNNKVFSFSDYQAIEINVLFVLYHIFLEKKITSFEITELEHSERTKYRIYKKLKKARLTGDMYNRLMRYSKIGIKIDSIDALALCRLTLRNCLWCKLVGGESINQVHVDFGWDYYVYVSCSEISEETIRIAQSVGVYIERMAS